ncbi:MAG: mucin-binding protein [Lactobacillus gasseri]
MNNRKYIKNSANARQRFSIRKLTIGTASVLLGTVFYLGTSETTAQAASADSAEKEVQTVATSPIVKNEATTVKSSADTNAKTQVVHQKTAELAKTDVENKTDKSTVQATEVNVDKKDDKPVATKDVNSAEKVRQNTQTLDTLKAVPTNTAELNESKAENTYTDFTVDKDKIDTEDSVTFNFSTNEAKAGDVYKIVIPETTTDGFDGTTKDGESADKKTATIDSVDFGQFDSSYGTATKTYDADKKQWVITDTFTHDNTSSQPIILTTSNHFRDDKLHSTGTFTRQAFLYNNDHLLKTVEFKQTVTDSVYLYWEQGGDSKNSLYTTKGNKVNVDSNENYPLLANTDYEWHLNISNFNENFNYGTTLEIPMPENFVLNTDATNKANNSGLSAYNASFSQDGTVVKLTLPQLSEAQLSRASNIYSAVKIIGQFKMDVPRGNTQLSNSNQPTITQQTNAVGDKSSSSINPVTVTILGKDHGLDSLPIGDIFTATIDPDRYEFKSDGSIDDSKPVTPMEDTRNHNLNSSISARNTTAYNLKNVVMTVNIPDGMNISGLSVPSNTNGFKYTFTLADGTTETGSVDVNNQSTILKDNAGKLIKKVVLTFDELNAFESTPNFGLNGVLAKTYADGSEVKVGNNLHTDLYVTADGINNSSAPALFTQNQIIVEKIPVRPEVHYNTITASGRQDNKVPGASEAGRISSYISDLLNKPEKLTYYAVLPTNAVLSSINKTALPRDVKITSFKVNGRTVVKISGEFTATNQNWELVLNNSNLITHLNLSSDLQVYLALPEGEKLSNTSYRVTDQSLLPFVENSENAYRLTTSNWDVIAATGTYSKSLAQGNQDIDLLFKGQSDDKGSWNMTFSNVLVNSEDKDTYNAVVVSHVPGTDDGKSQFDFKLKDANSVQVVNTATGDIIESGIEKYYSTENINLNSIKWDDPSLKSHFVTADKVTDWAKIKTVLTTISVVPANSTYGVTLNGYDPTFEKDLNKTAYGSSVAWTDLLKPIVINAGDKNSASVTISGQSTINFKLHFNDGSQADILVPDINHTYKDGVDTVNKSDFIKATKNSDYDNAVNNKDYSLIPKAVLDAIPNGYVLDVESGAKIENSDTKYPNGMKNGTAEFGKTSMYYFDGDTVVYNLIKANSFTKKIIVKRNVKFENIDKPGVALKPDYNKKLDPIEVSGLYNPLTGRIISIADFSSKTSSLDLKEYSFPDEINGLIYQSANATVSYNQNQEHVIPKVSGSLIGSYVRVRGIGTGKFDTKGKAYNINDPYNIKELSAAKVDDNTIEFDQNILIQYGSNHANLVLIGQALGKTNQLLDSSIGNDKDKITFKYTDKQLQRDGYTYKIYYAEDGSSLASLAASAIGSVINGEDAVHAINQSWLINYATQNSFPAYDSLADALKANNQYDSSADGNVVSDYTQNFFVVYTPVQQEKQNFYIISDNDPYRRDPITKQFALPETTQDADKSGTDYFKIQGNKGSEVIPYNESGGARYNSLYNQGSATNYSQGQYDYDANGNLIKHNPGIPSDDSNPYLSGLMVYQRTGYYIDEAIYEYKDSQGKKHQIKFNVELTKNFDLSQAGNVSYSSDNGLLPILNYLTSGPSNSGKKCYLMPESYTSDTTPYKIKISGSEDWKVKDDESGVSYVDIPADEIWTFDNTDYDSSKMQDPSPQILHLHYAPTPLSEDGSVAKVQIHYVDVTGVDHLNPENQGITYKLNPSTSKYGAYMGNELELDNQGNPPSIFNIANVDQSYDNTNKDNEIVSKLAKEGYVVVQRDKQTRGKQQFNIFDSDQGNGSYDSNDAGMRYSGYLWATLNYYVFLKKQAQYPANYQVLLENDNGTVEKELVGLTELGIGGQDEDIATSFADPTGHSLETLEQKYQSIIDTLKKNPKYKNYDFVLEPTDNKKLKVTDKINGNFSDTESKLFTIYATYKKGKVTVHYIDVNGSAKTKDFNSSDGTEISDTAQNLTDKNYGDSYSNELWDYAQNNYILAADVPNAATSGIISAPNKDVYVYLKHATTTTVQHATLHENIKYQYKDGSKVANDYDRTIKYSRTKTHDLVTNNDSEWSAWKPVINQKDTNFETVTSPLINGYTADKKEITAPVPVDSDFENEKTHNYNYVVTYSPDNQKIIVNYIDDTTGKTLSTKELNGKSDEKSDYTTKDSIAEYEKQHYDLVSDDTNGNELLFDHDDDVDQVYNVHLTHHMTPINDTKTINETIHYIYEDGKTVSPDVVGTPVVFTHDGERDEVTNKEHWNDWKSEKDSFDAVKSPEVAGYTPDIDTVPEIKVEPTDSDIDRTVTYKADEQKAKLRFYDDTDHKFIELAPDINTTGQSNGNISFNVPYDFSNYSFIEVDSSNDPADKSNKLNGDTLDKVNYGNFDKDKNTDQIFIAHFTHKTAPVKDTKTVTETVHYVYEDGTKAHDDVQKEVTFTKTGTKDLVTGEEKSNWSKSKEFEEVVSPEIAGYTPDQEKIDSVTVSHDSKDIVRIVTYKANPQKITVNYVDDTTGKTLATKELNGKSDEKSGYTTGDSIANYEKQHYDLVSDETNGSELIFDHDDKVDQVYNVHLIHHLSSISDTKTINETIHYVYEDGKTARPDVIGTPVVFTRDGERDEVTNEDMWNDWTTKKDSFDKVQSPEIVGYIPNVDAVPEIKVKPTDSDIDRTVTYKADEQKAKLRFYDDTDHKFIELAPDINTLGKSNENISFNVPYNLSNYSFIEVDSSNDPANKSDKLNGDSLDNVNYGRFDTDKNADQVFIAHFTHKTVPVKDTKAVTEIVHYLYEDGAKAHDDVQKQVIFTKTGSKDLVTGKEKSSWSGPQVFNEVFSPEITGYTPDQGKINSMAVSKDSKDIERTVIYKAKPVEPTTPDKPTQPSKPTKPEEQTIPNKPNQSNETESSKTVTQINKLNNSKNVEASNTSTSLTHTTYAVGTSRNVTSAKQINRARTTLPQTGSQKTDLSLAGLALASVGAIIGLIGGKERKRRKR